MTNMDLWHAVEKTPPSETTEIIGKPYKGNSPKPHYLVRKATETFGPCGIGWGFNIIEEKLLDGALLAPDFRERIHMAHVRVWYVYKDKRGEVEHVGQTVFCGKRNNGSLFTDEDAPKKSVTDALVKALSMIGFAGDIFAGRYDDSKYVAELRQEEAAQKAAAAAPARITAPKPQPPQQPAQAPEPASGKPVEFDPHAPKAAMTGKPAAEAMQAFCGTFTGQVRAARTIAQLDELWSINEAILTRVQEKNPRAFDTVMEAFNARQAEAPGPMAGG